MIDFHKLYGRLQHNMDELAHWVLEQVNQTHGNAVGGYEEATNIHFSEYNDILNQIFRTIQLKFIDEICLAHCRIYPFSARWIMGEIDNTIESDFVNVGDVDFSYFWRRRNKFKRFFYITDENEFKELLQDIRMQNLSD